MEELLRSQRVRIERAFAKYRSKEDPAQMSIPNVDRLLPEERRQIEADHGYWRRRLAAIDVELRDEPLRIRESYAVRATRIEPVGVVYLVPVKG